MLVLIIQYLGVVRFCCPITCAEKVLQARLLVVTLLLTAGIGAAAEKQFTIVVSGHELVDFMQYAPNARLLKTPVVLQLINSFALLYKQNFGLARLLVLAVAVKVEQLLLVMEMETSFTMVGGPALKHLLIVVSMQAS